MPWVARREEYNFLNTERRLKSPSIFLLMAILSVVLILVYFFCLDLTDENLFSDSLVYRNPDQVDMPNTLQKESKVFVGPGGLNQVFYLETY
jgi:hypothetical protein